MQFVSTDEDVQFHWSMTSVDIQNDDDQSELLKEIVGLWLNTRGFSISKLWMENYKFEQKETVKRKKSLRTSLKGCDQCTANQ